MLDLTRDSEETDDGISSGGFLMGAPNSNPRGSRVRYRRDEGKGNASAKAVSRKCEVIDLCSSSDEGPSYSTAQDSRRTSKSQTTNSRSSNNKNTTRPNPSRPPPRSITPSLLSIIKPYTGVITIPKQAKPSAQRYETPPLFRYCPSSTTASPSPPPEPPRDKRQRTPTAPLEPDPPAATTPPSKKKQKIVHIIDSDDDSDLEPPTLTLQPASPAAKKRPGLSATTRALLREFAEYSTDGSDQDLDKNRRPSKPAPKKKPPTAGGRTAPGGTKRKTREEDVVEIDGDDETSEQHDSSAERPPKRNSRLSETEKARRAAEKEVAQLVKQREREAKAAEKEALKSQKQREREAKEAEKKREQELISVNKLKTSRKDSASEMIVDISIDLAASAIGDQLRRFILGLGSEANHEWDPVNTSEGHCRVVKWRRRVKAEYSEERGMFLPLQVERIEHERHILVYLTAKEFLDITTGSKDCIAGHVSRTKRLHPGRAEDVKIIYLIEGLTTLIRKNKSNRNRQYQNRVRAQLGNGEGSNSATDADLIDEDLIEDARLTLQVIHGCLIHETQAAIESMEWITKFTGDISTIPYKKSRVVADVAFCADIGQVKTGLGRADTYSRMLEEINRVTPSVANGVASEYPDVQALVKAFKLHGEHAIEDLPNIATKDGLPMNRNIGAACSRRIYGIFMGMDPYSTDV